MTATLHTIHFVATNDDHTVDESTTLQQMKAAEPTFFSEENRRFFHDESYEVYRGQLIVHGYFQPSQGPRQPKTTVYLFLTDQRETFNIARNADDPEAIIDRALDTENLIPSLSRP